jgi:hypothetical protein
MVGQTCDRTQIATFLGTASRDPNFALYVLVLFSQAR